MNEKDLIDFESNIIKFIDNNKEDYLIIKDQEWEYSTYLFGNKEFEKVCEEYFWHEVWFIQQLIKELGSRTMEDIVNTYQFNIWFNEWLKQSAVSLEEHLSKALWTKDESKEIADEIWAINLPTDKWDNVTNNS